MHIGQWWIITGLSLRNKNYMILHMDYHWMTYYIWITTKNILMTIWSDVISCLHPLKDYWTVYFASLRTLNKLTSAAFFLKKGEMSDAGFTIALRTATLRYSELVKKIWLIRRKKLFDKNWVKIMHKCVVVEVFLMGNLTITFCNFCCFRCASS